MNYICLIFVVLLWHTKESHAVKETNKMDTFERKLGEFESQLTYLSGRLNTVEGKLKGMETASSLDQCKDCDELPTCGRYRGRVCSTHIGNRSIYSNITRKDMFHKEESIKAALTLLTGLMSASDECMQYLIPSICIFNFPQCELETMFDVRRMCRDECEMLENTTCKDVYKLSQYYPAVRYLLPKCDTLPQDNTHCVRIGLISKGSHDKLEGMDTASSLDMVDSAGSLDPCKDCDEQPTCGRYRGSVCSTHIGNRSIYSNSTRKDMLHKEESLIAALTVLTSSMSASDECVEYLIPSVCIFNFPQCELETMFDVRRMCRDECEMLENTTCKDVYKLSQYYPAVRYLLPKCDTLPQDNTHCVRIGLISNGSHDETAAKEMLPVLEFNALGMMARAAHLSWLDNTLDSTQKVTDGRYYTVRYTPIPKSKKYLKMRVKETMVKIENLLPNTTYEFSVRVSNNGLKSKWSKPVTDTTNTLSIFTGSSLPPRNVRARVKDSQFVVVEWDPPKDASTADIQGYKVYFTHDPLRPVSLWQQEVIRDNKTSVVVEPERPTTTNYFSVVSLAHDSYESPMSKPVKLTPKEAGGYPLNLTVKSLHDDPSSVFVSWQQQGSGPISAYVVYYTTNPSLNDTKWTLEGVNGDQTSVKIEHLIPGETYYFKIRTLTIGKGYGPISPSVEYQHIERNLPGPPRNVRAMARDQHTLIVEWDEPELSNGDIEGYRVTLISLPEPGRLPNFVPTQFEVGGDNTSLTVSSLKANTTYFISVLAFSDVGHGPASKAVQAVTKSEAPQTYPPNLAVIGVNGEHGTVLVTWEPPESVIPIYEYLIYYTTKPDRPFGYWLISIVKGDILSTQIYDLTPGETYYFTIKAVNAKGIGPMSPPVSYENP